MAAAGHDEQMAAALAAVAWSQPRVVPFGFTDEVPTRSDSSSTYAPNVTGWTQR